MKTHLDNIIDNKKAEICALNIDIAQAKKRVSTKSLKQSLQQPGLSIIAEIKRKSPSKGEFNDIINPNALAKQYIQGGAAAISILTDTKFFNGHIDDLKALHNDPMMSNTPLLRKDFIIDKMQIIEAIEAGADAILLIVAATGEKTKELLAFASSLNIEALVEVHTAKELEYALSINADIIGINNRNLHDFEVDLNHSLQLIKNIPESITTVSASGIHNTKDATIIAQAGFNAILVGEALVLADNPKTLIHQMQGTIPCSSQ